MLQIARLCHAIDLRAAEVYDALTESTDQVDLRAFWDAMAGEERRHVKFWDETVALAEQGMLPPVIEDVDRINQELTDIEEQSLQLQRQCADGLDVSGAFLAAYRMEFYLLHPAFEELFEYMRHAMPGVWNPSWEYDQHIQRFVDMNRKLGSMTPELELLGQALARLWQENRALARQASMDPLTGVLNRRGFFVAIRPMAHLAQRQARPVGFIVVDVDDFKRVNDELGHQTGDRVLRQIANGLQGAVRASDIIGRYGGEEFVVFLSTVDPRSLEAVAEKIRASAERSRPAEAAVTVSVGGVCDILDRDVEAGIDGLIKGADTAMYHAKERGKNQVVVLPPQ